MYVSAVCDDRFQAISELIRDCSKHRCFSCKWDISKTGEAQVLFTLIT